MDALPTGGELSRVTDGKGSRTGWLDGILPKVIKCTKIVLFDHDVYSFVAGRRGRCHGI